MRSTQGTTRTAPPATRTHHVPSSVDRWWYVSPAGDGVYALGLPQVPYAEPDPTYGSAVARATVKRNLGE